MKWLIKSGGTYWTGSVWTEVLYFGKTYNMGEALDIIDKRFYRFTVTPNLIDPDREKRRKKKQKTNKKEYLRRTDGEL